MITGGNKGLGLHLAHRYRADSFSQTNGFDIAQRSHDLAAISLGYDLLINNAYAGFGQTILLDAVADAWAKANKGGTIINIGGVGSDDTGPPVAGWRAYNSHKRSLKHMSLQWTAAFRSNQVKFRTSLLTLDRLDTPHGRTTPQWTGNAIDLEDVYDMIELCRSARDCSCIGEIKIWVNLDFAPSS